MVSFDPANYEISEIYQGNFQSSLVSDTSAVILQKKSKIVGEFFFSSEMQFDRFY